MKHLLLTTIAAVLLVGSALELNAKEESPTREPSSLLKDSVKNRPAKPAKGTKRRPESRDHCPPYLQPTPTRICDWLK
jgi:hypothetical protein